MEVRIKRLSLIIQTVDNQIRDGAIYVIVTEVYGIHMAVIIQFIAVTQLRNFTFHDIPIKINYEMMIRVFFGACFMSHCFLFVAFIHGRNIY